MTRFAPLALALAAAALLSACVVPINTQPDANAFTKMGEQAVATCGAGNVKEVNAKSFTCK